MTKYSTPLINRSSFIISMTILCILNFYFYLPYSINIPSYINFLIQIIFISVSIFLMLSRYHDINKTGYNLFFLLIPILGPIIVIIQLTFFKSVKVNNKYFSEHSYAEVSK